MGKSRILPGDTNPPNHVKHSNPFSRFPVKLEVSGDMLRPRVSQTGLPLRCGGKLKGGQIDLQSELVLPLSAGPPLLASYS